MLLRLVLAVFLIGAPAALPSVALPADKPTARADLGIPPLPEDNGLAEMDVQYHEWRMAQERTRQIAVLALIATALGAHLLVLRSLGNGRGCPPSHIVGATGLVYIVLGTLILVLMVDNKDQLAASTGILGAVAGYLFGSWRDSPEKESARGQT